MIKKIFISTGVLLVLYSVFIRTRPVPPMPQNMWQENMVKMQEFVYNNSNTENIILGSSLSGGNSADPTRYYNLAAGGGNPFSGMEIIKQSKITPKKVFVETNYLLQKGIKDDKYLNTLFTPVLFTIRKQIPILREQNQPFSYLGKFVTRVCTKIFSWFEKKAPEPLPVAITQPTPTPQKDTTTIATIASKPIDSSSIQTPKVKVVSALFEKRVAEFKKNYQDTINVLAAINENLSLLENYADYMKGEGIEIILFEMPIDCSLSNEPQPILVRRKLNEFCLKHNIKQLPTPLCSDFTTYDGNHLDGESCLKYTSFFESEAEKIK